MGSEFETAIQQASGEELPGIIGELSRLQALALARLLAPSPTAIDDRLLTAAEAAKLLGCARQWLYRQKDLPFRRELSPGRIRFSSAGIQKFIAARDPHGSK